MKKALILGVILLSLLNSNTLAFPSAASDNSNITPLNHGAEY